MAKIRKNKGSGILEIRNLDVEIEVVQSSKDDCLLSVTLVDKDKNVFKDMGVVFVRKGDSITITGLNINVPVVFIN